MAVTQAVTGIGAVLKALIANGILVGRALGYPSKLRSYDRVVVQRKFQDERPVQDW